MRFSGSTSVGLTRGLNPNNPDLVNHVGRTVGPAEHRSYGEKKEHGAVPRLLVAALELKDPLMPCSKEQDLRNKAAEAD